MRSEGTRPPGLFACIKTPASLACPYLIACALPLIAPSACGQAFPNKPIRIVTTGIGGPSDFISRVIVQAIAGPLGQPVIVDNRVASAVADLVARAAPDGYTLMINSSGVWLAPFLQKTSYDPVRDFAAVSLLTTQPTILVAHPSLPVNSVRDLIALAKSRPGTLNYASSASGGTGHLAMELLKSMAGVDIVRVFYKSNAATLNALVSGEVQVAFNNANAVMPQIKAGKLKALAVSSAVPTQLVPGVPPVAASGVPGYEAENLTVLLAPAKTPAGVIQRLNREVVLAITSAEIREKFFNESLDVVGSSPEQLAAAIKSNMARMGKVIKDAGIRAD